jgi:hypothetical protein
MCAERVNWENELRQTWEQRCHRVAQEVYETADLTGLGQVEDASGWTTDSGGAGNGRHKLQMSRQIYLQAEDLADDTYLGHVSAVFHLPGSNGQCPVMPTSIWGTASSVSVDLDKDAAPFSDQEKPLWSLYEALVRHSDGTLLDLGLNEVFEKTKAALKKYAGATQNDLFLESYQMLADMKAQALVDYGLHNAFLEVKAATDHLEKEPTPAPGM